MFFHNLSSLQSGGGYKSSLKQVAWLPVHLWLNVGPNQFALKI